MSDSHCELVRIQGNVQGVCFRYYAKFEADRLGVRGWVKNLPDGSVEALICGSDAQLSSMRDWLSHGPPSARVQQIRTEPCREELCTANDFRIVY